MRQRQIKDRLTTKTERQILMLRQTQMRRTVFELFYLFVISLYPSLPCSSLPKHFSFKHFSFKHYSFPLCLSSASISRLLSSASISRLFQAPPCFSFVKYPCFLNIQMTTSTYIQQVKYVASTCGSENDGEKKFGK